MNRFVVDESLQVLLQFDGGGVTLRRFFVDRFQHDRFKVARDIGFDAARAIGVGVVDQIDQSYAIASLLKTGAGAM